VQFRNFHKTLPVPVLRELEDLNARDLEDSPRALEIYSQYGFGDLLLGERWSLLIGLIASLPFGLIAGFWVSRQVTLPVASVAQAAQMVAQGHFSVRAKAGRYRGEMADMVRDFNQMTDSLEGLERERKATAAAISHELRTPLAVLRARLHAVCDRCHRAHGRRMPHAAGPGRAPDAAGGGSAYAVAGRCGAAVAAQRGAGSGGAGE